jgi:hypothetical protein
MSASLGILSLASPHMQISIGPEQVNELMLKLQDAIAAGNAPEAVLVERGLRR